MNTTTQERIQAQSTPPVPADVHHRTRLQGAAAALAILVAAVHVVDQGGIIGDKTPSYVGIGYWMLEIVALAVAVVLYTKSARLLTWLVTFGVGAGPLLGFILSRGPGLPSYADDRGNWSEPLGIISLVIEGLLVLVAIAGAQLSRSEA